MLTDLQQITAIRNQTFAQIAEIDRQSQANLHRRGSKRRLGRLPEAASGYDRLVRPADRRPDSL